MVFGYTVAEVRKFLLAVAGFVSVFVAQGLLTGELQVWVSAVIAAADAFLIFFVSNADEEKDALRRERDVANRANPDRYNTGGDGPVSHAVPPASSGGGLGQGPGLTPRSGRVNVGDRYDDEDDEPPHGHRVP